MRAYKLALRRAEKHLASQDRRLAKVIASHGKCELAPYWHRSPYESLVQAVAYQQLHANAARAIVGRMVARFTPLQFPAPEQLAALDIVEYRAFGFSKSKGETIRGIAAAALIGMVPTREQAEGMTDEELIDQLTALRGIGRWTVEMLLIFTLGRLDVMPVDDFGVKVGLQSVHGLDEVPRKQDFARLTEDWAPYRSIGAWYLWRVADRLKEKSKVAKSV